MTDSLSTENGILSTPNGRRVPDWVILSIACVAQFMVVLDVSIVNVALPSIGRDLRYSPTGLQWVVNAYVLTFAGFLLLGRPGRRSLRPPPGLPVRVGRLHPGQSGRGSGPELGLADHGPRRAGHRWSLLVARHPHHHRHHVLGGPAGQGPRGLERGGRAPAGRPVPSSAASSRPKPRGAGSCSSISPSASPPARPRSCTSPRPSDPRARERATKLDIGGAITVTAGLGALIFAIVGTDTHAWGSSYTLSILAVAAVLLAIFAFIELKVASTPLVPFRLFRSRSVSGSNFVMFLVGAAFFSMWYFMSLYLQNVLGYGALKAGLAFFPMAISIIIGAQVSSRLLPRLGVRPLLLVGTALACGGLRLALPDPVHQHLLEPRLRSGLRHLVGPRPALHAAGFGRHSGSALHGGRAWPRESSTPRARWAARSVWPSWPRWPSTTPTRVLRAGQGSVSTAVALTAGLRPGVRGGLHPRPGRLRGLVHRPLHRQEDARERGRTHGGRRRGRRRRGPQPRFDGRPPPTCGPRRRSRWPLDGGEAASGGEAAAPSLARVPPHCSAAWATSRCGTSRSPASRRSAPPCGASVARHRDWASSRTSPVRISCWRCRVPAVGHFAAATPSGHWTGPPHPSTSMSCSTAMAPPRPGPRRCQPGPTDRGHRPTRQGDRASPRPTGTSSPVTTRPCRPAWPWPNLCRRRRTPSSCSRSTESPTNRRSAPPTAAPIGVHWVHRAGADPASSAKLVAALNGLDLPAGRGHAYLAGELRVVADMRRTLLERGLTTAQISAKPYWRAGVANAAHGEPERPSPDE